jgi:hypothetical protein
LGARGELSIVHIAAHQEQYSACAQVGFRCQDFVRADLIGDERCDALRHALPALARPPHVDAGQALSRPPQVILYVAKIFHRALERPRGDEPELTARPRSGLDRRGECQRRYEDDRGLGRCRARRRGTSREHPEPDGTWQEPGQREVQREIPMLGPNREQVDQVHRRDEQQASRVPEVEQRKQRAPQQDRRDVHVEEHCVHTCQDERGRHMTPRPPGEIGREGIEAGEEPRLDGKRGRAGNHSAQRQHGQQPHAPIDASVGVQRQHHARETDNRRVEAPIFANERQPQQAE